MAKAQIYFYQQMQNKKPDGRILRIVGTQLVLEGIALFDSTTNIDGVATSQASKVVGALGENLAVQLGARGLVDYDVLLYQRFGGDCYKESEFSRGPNDKSGLIPTGNDVVAHMQNSFMRGLTLNNEEDFGRLWKRLHPKE